MIRTDRLESRVLLSSADLELSHVPGVCSCSGCALPPDAGKWDFSLASRASGPESNVPLSQLPLLNSKPDAPVRLLLDFDGRNVPVWGTRLPGVQPAYTLDADDTTYSPQELTNIHEIWRRVSEKYAPFNVNVTTQDPGSIIARQTFVVMISGTGSWYGSAGGVAFINGFQSGGTSGIGWVFSAQSPSNLQFIAEAAAHEAGHGFGVYHQSTYSGGTLQQEYNPGNSLRSPIMGNSYSTRRGTWWQGPTSAFGGGIQNDVDVLSRPANIFGYRADEAGGTVQTAAALPLSGFNVNGTGYLTTNTDVDMYSFAAGTGLITLSVVGPSNSFGVNIGTIDPSLALLDAQGNVLVNRANANANETLTYNVTSAGQFFVRVSSHGELGDIGTYTLTGTVPSANLPASPASLALSAESDQGVSSTDGVTNINTPTLTGLAQPGATVRVYRDLQLLGMTTANPDADWSFTLPTLADGSYHFYATAQDERGTSMPSQTFAVTIDTVAPALLSSSYDHEEQQLFYYQFSEPVAASLSPTSLRLINRNTNSEIVQEFNTTFIQGTTIITPVQIIPDGNYFARFAPGTATDAAGNTSTGLVDIDFWVLAGDGNRDRRVSLNDFTLLASNFGQNGRNFRRGDYNYDDAVNLDDFTILAANFGKFLAPPPADVPARASPFSGSPVFAGERLAGDWLDLEPSAGVVI